MGGNFVIGVSGGTGAGKSTIANALADWLTSDHAVIIQEDHYYRDHSRESFSNREEMNYDHPEAIDLNLLMEHIGALVSGKRIEMPSYDFTRHVRTSERRTVFPKKFIIVEGLFVLFDTRLRENLDLKVFVHLESDLRFIRRLERDISERGRSRKSVIRQYLRTVRPMHHAFVEPTRTSADLILSGEDPISFNVAKVREFLVAREVL
ncbi:MAG: uridine kinase [Syntrophobacteraceae bacterium]